tara:strand:- start:3109 stop:3288 length:180 start_codon:yes stop_codon:yes gene_type:complete
MGLAYMAVEYGGAFPMLALMGLADMAVEHGDMEMGQALPLLATLPPALLGMLMKYEPMP